MHTFWGYPSGPFKDHIDFRSDDQFQIGRDLTAEAEAEAEAAAHAQAEPKPSASDEAAR